MIIIIIIITTGIRDVDHIRLMRIEEGAVEVQVYVVHRHHRLIARDDAAETLSQIPGQIPGQIPTPTVLVLAQDQRVAPEAVAVEVAVLPEVVVVQVREVDRHRQNHPLLRKRTETLSMVM